MIGLRRIQRRRGLVWLVLAALLAFAAAVFTARAASGRTTPMEQVYVARAVIPAGSALDVPEADAVLALQPVPAGLALDGLVRDREQLRGLRTLAAIAPGEPVTLSLVGGNPEIGPAPLAPGERAIPVPLSAAGGSASTLVPGSRVDAVASTGEGASGRSAVVVAGAEVLAVGAVAGETPSDVPAGTALLRVSASQALQLTAALNFAQEVRLLIRPFDEPLGPPPPPEAAPHP